MNDLLDFVLDAHCGLERWSGVSSLTAKLDVGGPFWAQLGFPDAFLDENLTIDTHRQHAVFTPGPFPARAWPSTPTPNGSFFRPPTARPSTA